MKLQIAENIARRIIGELSPHCLKVEIGGSIRRKKRQVKDIEVICLPKMQTPRLRSSSFCKTVFDLGNVRKGKIGIGKYIKIFLPEKIYLDLFIAEPANWGMIYIIRTGSAEFSRHILTEFNRRGYHCEGGYPKKGSEALSFTEEQQIFDFLEMDFVDPSDRDV